MRYTGQIRKYLSLAAAAGLSACMLFGCTRADVASSSKEAPAANGSVSQSTVSGVTSDTLAGAGASQLSQADAASNTAETAAPAAAPSQELQQPAGQTTQNVSGTTTTNTPSAPDAAALQSDAQAQVQVQTDAPVDETPYESYDVPDGAALEAFTGEFEKSDGEESVVITLLNDNQISFQFTNSGIGAMAAAGGSEAVYYGDDGYSIHFDVAGDTLAVSVEGEEGRMSPMNGIYYRDLGAEENVEADEWQEEVYDADAAEADDDMDPVIEEEPESEELYPAPEDAPQMEE